MIKKNNNLIISFINAFSGVYIILKRERNLKIHLMVFLVVIFAGVYFRLEILEWTTILLASALVIISEITNSVVEVTVDLITRKEKMRAKIAKDAAAGSVLISSLIAIVIGFLVFYNRLVGGN